MRLIAAGLTNVGMKRDHNEDNLVLVPSENLYVVADGMGGHASGEVASEITVRAMQEFFERTSADEESTWPYREDRSLKYEENRLVNSIKLANRTIYETAQADRSKHGMGTTVVSIYFTNTGAYVAHCGDSRCYRFRDGELTHVTTDHSLLNDYMRAHTLTEEEIEAFPHKNVITRALGMRDSVEVEVGRVEPLPGDLYLLCSDGLNGFVTDEDINKHVQSFLQSGDEAKANDVEGICSVLIDAANAGGGKDNVTCIAVKILEG